MDQQASISPFLPGTNIQFGWDSTSFGWIKTCARLYQYSMIEGWRSRGQHVHLDFGSFYHAALELYDRHKATGADHNEALYEAVKYCLEVTWVYPGLETVEVREVEPKTEGGISWGTHEVIQQFPVEGKPMDWGHNLKTRETLVRSVIWYLEEFGEKDAAQTVILANGKPAVELSFRLELDYGPKQQPRSDGPSMIPGGISYTVQQQPYILSGHLDRVVSFQDGIYVMDRKTSSTTIGSYYFYGNNPNNQMSLYTFAR